jgi:penicillin-binding protein 1A
MRFKIIFFSVVVLAGFLAGGYITLATGIPSISELKRYHSVPGTKVYDDDDNFIGEFKVEKGIFVPLGKIPANLKNALLAVEDSRFYRHKGLDYIGIARAIFKDIIHASLREGGSTITQQLAKVLYLSPEKTFTRKIREARLAMELEGELSKDEILELYLNRVYFGHGAYGVEMASRIYYGKHIGEITLPEAALLASLVKAPTTYSPYNDLVKAKERQKLVLARMEEEGYIKPSQSEAAGKQPIALSSLRTNTEAYNYFLEYIRQQLERSYGVDTVYKGGLKVYTTMDKRAQAAAQRALQEGLRAVDKRRGWRGAIGFKENLKDNEGDAGKVSFSASVGDISTGVVLAVNAKEARVKARGLMGVLSLTDAGWAANVLDPKTGKMNYLKKFKMTDILKKGDLIWVKFKTIAGGGVTFELEQEPEVEGAVAAIDPDNGFVRALVGGFGFSKSEFNRAVYAGRQPGSAIKPVIYASALENGFTPASIINDEPVSYPGAAGGKDWSPENYDRQFHGPTRLREALVFSRNVVTVKLVEAVGIDKVLSFAKDVGINSPMPRDLTVALGSISLTPLELAMTYSTFANGGIRYNPITIKYVVDASNIVIESNEPDGVESVSPQSAYQITSMMRDVIGYGTGTAAQIGRPAAGKTGTSNDYKDAWFVGYTPQLVGCVWIGYDDMKRTLGRGEVGGRAAAPVWSNFMNSVLSDQEPEDFRIPEGIVKAVVDPVTGLLEPDDINGIVEYFKTGTQPKTYSENQGAGKKAEKPAAEAFGD